MKKQMLVGFMVMMAAFATQAAERFPIRFGGEQMRGSNTIMLRQELRRTHGVRAADYRLEKVVLVAKTKAGRGSAYLSVGGRETYDQTIDGRPRDFHTEDRYTYDRYEFYNPQRRGSDGAWQLHLQGNFKIKRVVVFMERKRVRPNPRPTPRPGRMVFTTFGEQRFDKMIEDVERYSVHKRGVTALRITAKKNGVSVSTVRVRYRNGEVDNAYELEGYLSEGDSRTMYLSPRGRTVESVTITGSSGLFGSRGKIELEAASRR